MPADSQKFIARNRAPRVQIEYDVELYGAQKSVQLAFVMGVMSDLAGKSPQPDIADRKFLQIDVDNFDARMQAIAPRATFSVPNTLTGEGQLPVDLTFTSMDDFSPEGIARNIAPLRQMLEARAQLSNLMAYMDGKSGAEDLIARLLSDPALLRAATSATPATDDGAGALDSLRRAAPSQEPPADDRMAALDALRSATVAVVPAQDDPVATLAALRRPAPEQPDPTADALDALRNMAPIPDALPSDGGDALDALRRTAPDPSTDSDRHSSALDGLRHSTPLPDPSDTGIGSALDALRDTAHDASRPDDLGDALNALRRTPTAPADDDRPLTPDALRDMVPPPPAPHLAAGAGDDLDDLFADLDAQDPAVSDPALEMDDLLGGLTDQPAPPTHADQPSVVINGAAADPQADDLDDLLGGLDDEPQPVAAPLDDLLGGLGDEPQAVAAPIDDLDDLLGGLDDEPQPVAAPLDDLDDLLAEATMTVQVQLASRFGTAAQPAAFPSRQDRRRFRMALLGDFTGRAAQGIIRKGDDLAGQAGLVLDPDTVEDVIAGFATTLVLPLGPDGAAVQIPVAGLDDLHPDALFATLPVFAELKALRQQLSAAGTVQRATDRLTGWAAAHDRHLAPTQRTAHGSTLRADLRLSEFQTLIGATERPPAPLDDLLARVVGPYVRRAPDPGAAAMLAAVDAALSGTMRLILHHPDFQALEAQWRSLDLIARSVEADDMQEVVLFDVSAEELAVDLTAADDLSDCGMLRLLTQAALDPDTGRGAFSAIIGLYGFAETPPHAELLGRIAQVAAAIDAPFVAGIAPAFLDTPKDERHPLVADAWDSLTDLPQAGYVGLVSPRFLMRHPYGAKTDPIEAFRFEEFTLSEGLSGMLWANPAVLAAILLARSFAKNGRGMQLGSVMALGDMPFHVVTDPHGDQIALPCTEAMVTLDGHRRAVQRGVMPVMAVKGRDELRLGSFNSLAGTELRGPWSADPPPMAHRVDPDPVPPAAALDDLDDLLAGFDDLMPQASGDPAQDDDIDAALAALLNDL